MPGHKNARVFSLPYTAVCMTSSLYLETRSYHNLQDCGHDFQLTTIIACTRSVLLYVFCTVLSNPVCFMCFMFYFKVCTTAMPLSLEMRLYWEFPSVTWVPLDSWEWEWEWLDGNWKELKLHIFPFPSSSSWSLNALMDPCFCIITCLRLLGKVSLWISTRIALTLHV